MKCLEKEPAKRYGAAQELADDLARFLRDEPIHTHPVTRAEHAWRWCRRKPALASFIAATVLLLLAIAVGSPIAAYRINQALKAEQVQLKRAEEESLKARRNLYAAHMNLAQQAVQEAEFGRALQLLDGHRPRRQETGGRGQETGIREQNSDRTFDRSLTPDARLLTSDLRGWEWRYLWRQ
ncbi:MAG: hypothetical protein DME26_14630, partial [Verrucomicrobia bacterium]